MSPDLSSDAAPVGPARAGPVVLLPFVLVSFAANSLVTRHVVSAGLFDAGLLSAVRFLSGAAALLVICLARRERVVIGRTNLRPALWLGVYAVSISYGYRHIGAAAGTFVFYASVLLTLIGHDLLTGSRVLPRRGVGAVVSFAGIVVLTVGSVGAVTLLGVVLLALTGFAWGLYTAAGRAGSDPRAATTGNFAVLGAVLVVPAVVGVSAGLQTSATGLAWAVGMGVVTTALGYVAWYACQRSMSATTAGTVQLVIPVLTAAGAVAFLGEQLSVTLWIAAALVGAGMWLGRPRPDPRR